MGGVTLIVHPLKPFWLHSFLTVTGFAMIVRTSCVLQCLRQSLVALIALAAVTAPSMASAEKVLFDVDFNKWDEWQYTLERAADDFGWHNPVWHRYWGAPRTYINEDVRKGSDGASLEFKMPAGVAGWHQSGALAMMTFDRQGTTYWDTTAEYDFRFSSEFDFAQGGKLPGLGAGIIASGGVHPKDDASLGYTARFMWRRDGKIVLYLYAINSDGWVDPYSEVMYGEDIQLKYVYGSRAGDDVVAVPDTWYHIKQQIMMNDPGIANGIMKVWINNALVLDKRDIMYRGADHQHLRTDNLYLLSFPGGGNTPEYISRNDRSVFIDNVKVYTP